MNKLIELLSKQEGDVLRLLHRYGILVSYDADGNPSFEFYEYWKRIDGSKLNFRGEAWTDGEYLMFVKPMFSVEQFLYYMGAEREAEIEFCVDKIRIYSGIDEERFERWAA